MYLEIFPADFAFFWEFRGISRKYLNFAGPRPSEISEALLVEAIIREFFVNLEGIFPRF